LRNPSYKKCTYIWEDSITKAGGNSENGPIHSHACRTHTFILTLMAKPVHLFVACGHTCGHNHDHLLKAARQNDPALRACPIYMRPMTSIYNHVKNVNLHKNCSSACPAHHSCTNRQQKTRDVTNEEWEKWGQTVYHAFKHRTSKVQQFFQDSSNRHLFPWMDAYLSKQEQHGKVEGQDMYDGTYLLTSNNTDGTTASAHSLSKPKPGKMQLDGRPMQDPSGNTLSELNHSNCLDLMCRQQGASRRVFAVSSSMTD
jgi:hypothetical protein